MSENRMSALADKVGLAQKCAEVNVHWHPRIIGELNGQQVKIAKIEGAFDWHHHEREDELFLVHRGTFRMEFRDRSVDLSPGDMLIVPRGVEHRLVAEHEAEIVRSEPAGTLNTGNVVSERTVRELERI